ncbi:MAG: GtrA family protein [Saprospiraceae bacterium]
MHRTEPNTGPAQPPREVPGRADRREETRSGRANSEPGRDRPRRQAGARPKPLWKKIWQFGWEKLPFALTGLVSTGINYGLYLWLVDRYLPPLPATTISYASSVLISFYLQRYFVFKLNRSFRSAFILAMLVSLGGLLLDAALVYGFHFIPWLAAREWLLKGLATGLVFFYNFYGKRRVFEGKRNTPNRPAIPSALDPSALPAADKNR